MLKYGGGPVWRVVSFIDGGLCWYLTMGAHVMKRFSLQTCRKHIRSVQFDRTLLRTAPFFARSLIDTGFDTFDTYGVPIGRIFDFPTRDD